MTSGGSDTVVVVVTVVTVCWVAGPKDSCAMVECCGGIMEVVVVVVWVWVSSVFPWLGMLSSVGDAGAVERMPSAG